MLGRSRWCRLAYLARYITPAVTRRIFHVSVNTWIGFMVSGLQLVNVPLVVEEVRFIDMLIRMF